MELKTILIIVAILLLVWVGRRVCREGMSTVDRTLNITRDMVLHGDIVAQDGKPLGGGDQTRGPMPIDKIIISNQRDPFNPGYGTKYDKAAGDVRIRRILALTPNGTNVFGVEGNKLTDQGGSGNSKMWEGRFKGRNGYDPRKIQVKQTKGTTYNTTDRSVNNILSGKWDDLFETKGSVQRLEIEVKNDAGQKAPVEIKYLVFYLWLPDKFRRYTIQLYGEGQARFYQVPLDLRSDNPLYIIEL